MSPYAQHGSEIQSIEIYWPDSQRLRLVFEFFDCARRGIPFLLLDNRTARAGVVGHYASTEMTVKVTPTF